MAQSAVITFSPLPFQQNIQKQTTIYNVTTNFALVGVLHSRRRSSFQSAWDPHLVRLDIGRLRGQSYPLGTLHDLLTIVVVGLLLTSQQEGRQYQKRWLGRFVGR